MELALEKVEEDNGRSCRSPLVSELTTRQQYVPTSYKITQNAASNRTEQFDDIVIDHFYTAIRAGLVDRKLPICDGAPTPSTMAMVYYARLWSVVAVKGEQRGVVIRLSTRSMQGWTGMLSFSRRGAK